MLSRLRSLLQGLLHRGRFEDGMAEEVRFHIEEYTNELVRSGLDPAEAARRARMEFGTVDSVKEDCRQSRGLRLFDELRRDLGYAVRLLAKTPAFTATALLTLALCVGANLAIFAVVDSVLLRPLPFPTPDRLVRVFNTYPKAGVFDDGASVTNYYERRGQLRAFESLAVYRHGTAIVGETGFTEREEVTRVSPDFFTTLGVGLARGRPFTDEETTYETDAVAILTDAYWRQLFDGDPNVVGRRVRVDGIENTVVGVLPPDFRFLSARARIYLPFASRREERGPRQRHSGSSSQMIARLRPGITVAEAQSQVDAQNAGLEAESPDARMMADAGFRSLVVPLHADHVAGVRPTLWLVQAAALLLLLIGAVNLVNLLLIHASGRVKELAVRRAIGASRQHVVASVMVETVLLTFVGGLLGLLVGAIGVRLVTVLGADRLPLGAHVAMGARSALVALVGAVVMGVTMGVPIAWHNARGDAMDALRSETRGGTASRGVRRLRHGFLVAQIALAFVLLAGAGLLGWSLEKVMALSPGFEPDRVASGYLSLPWKSYADGAARLTFTERLVTELERRPGVRAAGVATNVPLSGNVIKSAAYVKGHALRPGESPRGHYSYGVDGDYFAALGIPLLEGRFLEAADSRRSPRTCAVDADFARRYWPGGGAIGQRLVPGSAEGSDAEGFTIVGVVGAVKQAGLTEDDALGAVYYPYAHWSTDNSLFVVVRTSLPLESLGATLPDVVREIDPELPLSDVRSMETRIGQSLVARRSPALLAGLFSGMAVLLTAIGTYGVLSYAVAQRRREIALRMALGARPEQVRRQFLSLALRLLAAGIGLGLVGAALTGQAMQAVLYEVPAVHSMTLALTFAILASVSLVACLLPSHRASRISPMEALAEE